MRGQPGLEAKQQVGKLRRQLFRRPADRLDEQRITGAAVGYAGDQVGVRFPVEERGKLAADFVPGQRQWGMTLTFRCLLSSATRRCNCSADVGR